ncbi:hypothetical protein FACS189472_15840 [Alphaproteobacteria bacterium]|nr:hypothetical protein FACS189472_15840 [Alphaproteobacteria bacterium]
MLEDAGEGGEEEEVRKEEEEEEEEGEEDEEELRDADVERRLLCEGGGRRWLFCFSHLPFSASITS